MTVFTKPVVAWSGATDTDGPLVVLLHRRHGLSTAVVDQLSRWLHHLTTKETIS